MASRNIFYNLHSQQEMGKVPKHPLAFLDHFKICCPKNPNSLVRNPFPAVTYMFSPVNSKSCDISFPSSPNHPTSTRSSKNKSLGCCECRSKSCTTHRMIDDEFRSNRYSKPRIEGKVRVYTSPVSSDSDEKDRPITFSRIEKKSSKATKEKSKARFYPNVSSVDSDDDHSLFSSPPSLNSSCHYSHPSKTITEKHFNSREKMMQHKHIGPRRFKQFSSKEWKDDDEKAPLREYAEKKPLPERLMPHIVVKRSVDPYWDFKGSMLEMVWDQEMFDPKEMENLLMNFLSLNSRQHHKTIVEAFAEIWKEMYCGSWN